MRDTDLTNKARRKLIDFGFSAKDIVAEYSIQDKYRADLVVLWENKPYIVIEVKSISFPKDFKADYVRFDPMVKQAQSFASILEAPFFSVFNGQTFYWFSSNKSGRAELVDIPTVPDYPSNNIKTGKKEVLSLMQELRSFIVHHFGTWSVDDLGVIFYAQILDELGKPDFKANIKSGNIDDTEGDPLIDYKSISEKEALGELFYKISRINLTEVRPDELLLAIDDVFNQSKQTLFVPRWLADFMVKISGLTDRDKVIDLSSTHSNILSAILYNLEGININNLQGTYSNAKSHYWLLFQELLISRKEFKHLQVSSSNPNLKFLESRSLFDYAFIVPVFGGRFSYISEYSGKKLTDNLEILFEQALHLIKNSASIVFLASEGFLFSNRFRSIRNSLKETGYIHALISLPSDTFRPYSGLKTSLIVFRKGIPDRNNVFVAKIGEAPISDSFDCTNLNSVSAILHNYLQWNQRNFWTKSKSNYTINFDSLSYENLSLAYTQDEDDRPNDSGFEVYPLVNISKFIKKGTPVSLSDNGKIPLIGPGAIRELLIQENGLGLTDINKMSSNTVRVERGDVLVNSISTYRGAAAVVSSQFAGFPISQQVILIKPDQSLVYPEYLAIALNSKYVRDQIRQISSGAVISFIPVNYLKEITIPVPPKNKQLEIISRIKVSREKITQAEQTLKNLNDELTNLIDNLNVKDDKR